MSTDLIYNNPESIVDLMTVQETEHERVQGHVILHNSFGPDVEFDGVLIAAVEGYYPGSEWNKRDRNVILKLYRTKEGLFVGQRFNHWLDGIGQKLSKTIHAEEFAWIIYLFEYGELAKYLYHKAGMPCVNKI